MAAWPLVRADLDLSYVQVGVLLSAPHLLGNVLEPPLAVLGDAWDRRALIRAGGGAFAAALALIALSDGFWPLLAALALLSPAAGVFAGLSQATLMDADPHDRERNMARWSLAGSIGAVGGPLVAGAMIGAGLGWRAVFVALALATVLLVALVARPSAGGSGRLPSAEGRAPGAAFGAALARGARDVVAALRRREVVRWLVLLELANLMLDVLHGYLALYFVDVVGVSGAWGGIAVAVWTGAGLAGGALLIPLLEHASGTRYVRASSLSALVLFPAFLLVSGAGPKLVLLGAIALLNAGWYAVLQGRLYAAMPGRSATVLALGNVFGLAGSLLPLALGMIADRYGLRAAMWLLLVAPVALLVGLPRGERSAGPSAQGS